MSSAEHQFDDTSIREVMSDSDFERWHALFEGIFFDPEDTSPKEEIRRLWRGRVARARLFFIEDPSHEYEDPADHARFGRSIGVVMANVDSRLPKFAYVPYGGLHPAARGYTGAKQALKENALSAFETPLRRDGVKIVLIDCEDPDRAEAIAEEYRLRDAGRFQSVKSVENYARARLHFFARRGYNFIFDRTYKYCRPSSANPEFGIQDYDVLGFKIIEPKGFDCPYLQSHFCVDEVHVGSYLANDADAEGEGKYKTAKVAIFSAAAYKSLYAVLQTLDLCEESSWWRDFSVRNLDYMPWFQEWSLARRYAGANEFFRRANAAPPLHRFIAYNRTSMRRRAEDRFAAGKLDVAKIGWRRSPDGARIKTLIFRGSEGFVSYAKRRAIEFITMLPLRVVFFVIIISLGLAVGVPRKVIDCTTALDDCIAESVAGSLMSEEEVITAPRNIGPR